MAWLEKRRRRKESQELNLAVDGSALSAELSSPANFTFLGFEVKISRHMKKKRRLSFFCKRVFPANFGFLGF